MGQCLVNSKNEAIAAARAFAVERYPAASLVFLGGSWAGGSAHADSDLDVVIVDETADSVSFEGTTFGGFVVEACVLPSAIAQSFFKGSAEHRSAAVPPQVVDGLLLVGDERLASDIRRSAEDALAAGPKPLSEGEIGELRYELSLLLDLHHAAPEALRALAAFSHVALSRAVLDLNRAWRADRKSLRKAVATIDPISLPATIGRLNHQTKTCMLDTHTGFGVEVWANEQAICCKPGRLTRRRPRALIHGTAIRCS